MGKVCKHLKAFEPNSLHSQWRKKKSDGGKLFGLAVSLGKILCISYLWLWIYVLLKAEIELKAFMIACGFQFMLTDVVFLRGK